MSLLLDWWQARQRRIDMDILWPVLCAQAPDLDTARRAFLVHARQDLAWLALGDVELAARVAALPDGALKRPGGEAT